jgi:tRNA 2-thiocytidine biosynthesis protein TtcA
MSPARETPRHTQLEHRLARAVATAIRDFDMIEAGDRILVAMSGGKDSITMHHLLASLRLRAPLPFELVAVSLDQGQPGYRADTLADWLRVRGHELSVVREDTYSIVRDKIPEGATYCSLCSRLRRAILYRIAHEKGCTKIALGHHRDDAIVTLLLNLFFSGQLKSMPPKLVSDDGRSIVIRPLIYCAEDDIAEFAALSAFPILPCGLCGSQPNLERKAMSDLLARLEKDHPGLRAQALAALTNVRPSHLLDTRLWRRLGLRVATESSEPGGEIIDPDTLLP